MGVGRQIIAVIMAIFGLAGIGVHSLPAAALRNSDCLDCHEDKTLTRTNAASKSISLFVDQAKLRASAHATNTCAIATRM